MAVTLKRYIVNWAIIIIFTNRAGKTVLNMPIAPKYNEQTHQDRRHGYLNIGICIKKDG